ncbi:conjugative transposon protein TraM [Mucilaginibacter conchicola]|uniref:Conjugative transposon protein TraM n=2 Tax=Mucilaginibacter conchicola TaxID=2303333 RepID=A0A372NMQ1_9SPHI|nr:conjugative transposon protein TraM [Mucilaginibacter conchicola]
MLNPDFLRKRRFMLIIPVLVIPFLTMAFWALGGGVSRSQLSKTKTKPGINTTLPKARFNNDQGKDKLALYKQSQLDSAARSGEGVNSAFIKEMGLADPTAKPGFSRPASDQREEAGETADRINQKLALINKQINMPPPEKARGVPERQSEDVSRLHKMMKSMNSGQADPEMRQLNQMLDKIQAIQNPESAQAKPSLPADTKPFRAIPAVIDGKQKVADGAVVRLRLSDTTTIKNQLLNKGQLLFGACQVTNQRLLLTIRNIRTENNIIPVDLTVFSQDGMPGIPAPEAELAGSASYGADNAIQSMQVLSMDQSIAGQAAAGGVNAAKNLFGKKLKKVKVKLKDQFPVLLKINR